MVAKWHLHSSHWSWKQIDPAFREKAAGEICSQETLLWVLELELSAVLELFKEGADPCSAAWRLEVGSLGPAMSRLRIFQLPFNQFRDFPIIPTQPPHAGVCRFTWIHSIWPPSGSFQWLHTGFPFLFVWKKAIKLKKKIKCFFISIMLLSKENFNLFFSFFLYLLLIFFAHFSETGHVHVVLLGLGLM